MLGFPAGSDSKESACIAGDLGSIPGSERSLEEGNGYLLRILVWKIFLSTENIVDRGAWYISLRKLILIL